MWRDRLEWNKEAKSDAAHHGHALPEHNALRPSIPPLSYFSLCLNSTPTQKYATSHTELIDIFRGLSYIFSYQDNYPPIITLIDSVECQPCSSPVTKTVRAQNMATGGVGSGRQDQPVLLWDSDATWCANTVLQCKVAQIGCKFRTRQLKMGFSLQCQYKLLQAL